LIGHPDFNVLTSVLESESNVLINWFKVNKMQANPDKFQVLGTKMPSQRAKFKVTENERVEYS
jgi:hypothetical protein